VLLGGFAIPSWKLSTALLAATAIVAGLFAALLVASMSSDSPRESVASIGPILPNPTAVAVPTLHERAATGDAAAIKTLESTGARQRTVDDLLALTEGRAAQRRKGLAGIREDLKRNPNLGEDPDLLRRLRAAADDPELARDALGILATLPGPVPVDILYEIWMGTKGKTDITRLAEELVFLDSVRKNASPALAVVLDLRDAKDCQEVSKALDRALAHGDRRAARPLGLLTTRQGCGPRKAEDCYACLRSDQRIVDAVSAVLRRPKPQL
jgi:hypothetical protein